jgi:hypothetical protein
MTNLSAEKVQRVKPFRSRLTKFVARWQFSNAGAVDWVRKFQAVLSGSLSFPA